MKIFFPHAGDELAGALTHFAAAQRFSTLNRNIHSADAKQARHFIMRPARSFANFAPSGTGEPSATSAVS